MFHYTSASVVASLVTVRDEENMSLQDLMDVFQYTLRLKAHMPSTVTLYDKN